MKVRREKMEVGSMKDERKRMISYIGDGRDVDGPQSVTSRLNSSPIESGRVKMSRNQGMITIFTVCTDILF